MGAVVLVTKEGGWAVASVTIEGDWGGSFSHNRGRLVR